MNRLTDPRFTEKIHFGLTMFWVVNLPFVVGVYLMGDAVWEKVSILYLALISVWANIAGHWGAYQATRAEGHK